MNQQFYYNLRLCFITNYDANEWFSIFVIVLVLYREHHHIHHRALDQTLVLLVPAVPEVIVVHHQMIQENRGVEVDHNTQINREVKVIAAVDQKVVVVRRHSIQPIRNPVVILHLNIQPNLSHIVDHPLNIRLTQSPEVVQHRFIPLIRNREVVRCHNIQPIQSLAVDRHQSIRILVQMWVVKSGSDKF